MCRAYHFLMPPSCQTGGNMPDDIGLSSLTERIAASKKAGAITRFVVWITPIIGAAMLGITAYLGADLIQGIRKTQDTFQHTQELQWGTIEKLSDAQALIAADLKVVVQQIVDGKKARDDQIDTVQKDKDMDGSALQSLGSTVSQHESRIKCLEAKTTCR